ncbi:MAG TPA: Mpo1-like protein [Woeseiaceae bacterium]|nr:Mpo1-like protein [Woeseiaceae bacterium]
MRILQNMPGADNKLLEMLTGYAAAHQHPFNVFVHLVGIPTIMLGVLIPLTWLSVDLGPVEVSAAHVVLLAFFLFYLTLDALFALVFLAGGGLLLVLAGRIGDLPVGTGGALAAACFFGGYLAQFVGHAVERSMPVLVKHPVQANLAAPFFTVVEMFKLLGLRDELFHTVRRNVELQRARPTDSA